MLAGARRSRPSSGTASTGVDNADCARAADVVVVAVPWEGHARLLASLEDELAGKIVVDCVNPLGFDKQGAFALEVAEGSAAEQAASAAPALAASSGRSTTSVPSCCSTSHVDRVRHRRPGASATTERPPTSCRHWPAGSRECAGVYAGRLRNARQVEALTANLISVNRRYKAHAGVRVTDV